MLGVLRLSSNQRNRSGDVLEEQQRWSVIAAGTLGALIGSRTLGLLEQALSGRTSPLRKS